MVISGLATGHVLFSFARILGNPPERDGVCKFRDVYESMTRSVLI